MGKDFPDWGGKYVDGQFYPLDDMGELAARLGSPVTYDRRGSLIWSYNFAHGIVSGDKLTNGAASQLGPVTGTFESPPACCWLFAGGNAGDYASYVREMSMPLSKRIGFQASYRGSTGVSQIYHNIYHYTGSQYLQGVLRADFEDLTLAILVGAATYQEIATGFYDLSGGLYFSHFKLVVDLAIGYYVRAMVDDVEYDLSEYALHAVASTAAPRLRLRSTNWTKTGGTSALYLDNLIVTAAEP